MIKNKNVAVDAAIDQSKFALDDVWVFNEEFDKYPATADLVAAGTPWRDISAGGTAIIPATTLPGGVAQCVTGGAGANTAILTVKAPGAAHGLLDVSHGIDAWFRFQISSLTAATYQVGLYAAADSYAVLQFSAASVFFQFVSDDTTGASTSTSSVRARANVWYLLHMHISHRNRQVRTTLESPEANIIRGVPAQGGAHVVANVDTLVPYFAAVETAAVSKILSVDALRIAVPRYTP